MSTTPLLLPFPHHIWHAMPSDGKLPEGCGDQYVVIVNRVAGLFAEQITACYLPEPVRLEMKSTWTHYMVLEMPAPR